MGGEERRGASRARAAAGTAEEGKKCRSQEGTLRGDEGEMGEAEEGGQVESMKCSILIGRNALLECCAFGFGAAERGEQNLTVKRLEQILAG